MISYFHLPIIVFCFFLLMFMRRWWMCIDRMGYVKEVGHRAPSLIHGDIVAAVFAIMPFLLAVYDWSGLTLPRHSVPISPSIAVFLSVVCVAVAVSILRNSGERFQGSWAGSRESALRTIATLRIIDAAELAHALKYVQEREERTTQGQGHVIHAEVQEVRK
jgi:hypothetical protein